MLRVKAVPGAKRDAIVGLLGDRLKVRVAAPPEGGRANESIRRLITQALGLSAKAISIESGATSPEKLLRIRATRVEQVADQLVGPLSDGASLEAP
jgi:uncharacterized protein